jgi:hypothetical protein
METIAQQFWTRCNGCPEVLRLPGPAPLGWSADGWKAAMGCLSCGLASVYSAETSSEQLPSIDCVTLRVRFECRTQGCKTAVYVVTPSPIDEDKVFDAVRKKEWRLRLRCPEGHELEKANPRLIDVHRHDFPWTKP